MKRIILFSLSIALSTLLSAQSNVNVSEAKAIIAKQKNLQLVDVRTPAEFNAGHLEKAVLIDYYAADFKTQLLKLDKKRPILLYCRSGRRSGEAMQILKDAGYKNVYNLLGGMNEWNK